MLSSALPPLGLIRWASPLTAAGILFPGTNWIGLALAILIAGAMIVFPTPIVVIGVLVFATARYNSTDPPVPDDWEAVDMDLPAKPWSPTEEYTVATEIQQPAIYSRAHLIAFQNP